MKKFTGIKSERGYRKIFQYNKIARIFNKKGNNGIISIELNTVKDINNNYPEYNLIPLSEDWSLIMLKHSYS